MRILVLGGDGMVGHQLLLHLQKKHEVCVTLRQASSAYCRYPLFNTENSYFDVDIRHGDNLAKVLSSFKPDVVINAVGVIKQRQIANEAIPNIEINALFPHRLAEMCKAISARMIHFSTDCIFSGMKGNYTEADYSDAKDFYGKSKYLGEVKEKHCITLRSSVIGLELTRKASLIEWYLAQRGTIKGFRRAIYSGLTTQEMSRVVNLILTKYSDLSGVWHISADYINKHELLAILSKKLGREDIQIQPDDSFVCDRSLNGEAFRKATGYQSPSWEVMLNELSQQIQLRYGSRIVEGVI
ncbi:MAG: NAD(P)-dependent oxidoreductase [Gammaproteobacteria bacterium RIFCSPHIGHO2_12_FULL_37_14]|nr:MAG: NAD(P)-dependent oxidoreductase [Gammaproteobacteria bacterium RIFCSPHIGHO2_12_FULL_37_14]